MSAARKQIARFVPALVVLLCLIAADTILTYFNPIKYSTYMYRNDFELTQLKHPEKVWDKVFFGSSSVVAAYMEEESEHDYINMGVDYGQIRDLSAMLRGSFIEVGSEIVLGLNYLSLYDDFDTNPAYIWHKKVYTPYPYFQRDRLHPFMTDLFSGILSGNLPRPISEGQEKRAYHGHMSEEELHQRRLGYYERYWDLDISQFDINFNELEYLISYCEDNGIRLRAVWMPWSEMLEVPSIALQVKDRADAMFRDKGIDTLDLMDAVPAEYFHDFGHVTIERGAPYFTKIIDKWL